MKAPDQRMKENSIIVLTERRRKKHSYSLLDVGVRVLLCHRFGLLNKFCIMAPNLSRVPAFLSSLRLGFRQSQTYGMAL